MMTWQHEIDRIRRALADTTPVPPEELLLVRHLDGTSARPLAPEPAVTPRPAAALLLLYPQADDLWLPLTARSGRLPLHRGEVSLPGGATDPEDTDPEMTALREAHEEVGLDPAVVEVLGQLTPFYIPPSNFMLTPVVGFTPKPPTLQANPHEVDAVFSVPLKQLLDPATIVEEEWTLHEMPVQVPFFALEGYKVWGATAILLSELLARLRRITPSEE
jgi:8-oxo-dGTP pyrophosphatase MutT (NUDIX family)